MKALAEQRSVIFYDQLGCGLSDAPEDAHRYLANPHRHLDQVIDKFDIDQSPWLDTLRADCWRFSVDQSGRAPDHPAPSLVLVDPAGRADSAVG
jgi:pimeloyl-ACP methyl ester carboxylesterase